jgi:hypothetical protein
MKSRSMQILTVLTVVAGATRVATAAEPSSPWSLSISAGDSMSESGSLRTSMDADLADLGTLDPSLSGQSGTLHLDPLKYDDIFHRRYDTGLELDYSFSENLQTYGRFGYASLEGRTSTLGTVDSLSLATPATIHARFADADNMSLQFGTRYLWSTGTDWRPFAGLSLGATHLDEMRANITSTDLSMDIPDLRFARAGTVFSQSLQTGVDYAPTSAFGVRFSLDADHIARPPSGNDARTSQLGFGPSDEAHDLWSFPVSIAASYRF